MSSSSSSNQDLKRENAELRAQLLEAKFRAQLLEAKLETETAKREAAEAKLREAEARQAKPVTVIEKLAKLNINYASRDLRYLLNCDRTSYSILKSPDLTRQEAQACINAAKSKIKSDTGRQIGIHHSIMLDGPLAVVSGKPKSSFYYAFSESGGVLAAKIFHDNEEAFRSEVKSRDDIGEHTHIVNFVKHFSLLDRDNTHKHVIIMEYFPRSANDMYLQYSKKSLPIPFATTRAILKGSCFALFHIHSKGFCYGDLKPANIMLKDGKEGHISLVDFGGVVRLGHPTVELTEQYCLDCDTSVGSELLDWTCLASSICELNGADISIYNTRSCLADIVKESNALEGNIKKFLIKILVENPSSSVIRENFLLLFEQ